MVVEVDVRKTLEYTDEWDITEAMEELKAKEDGCIMNALRFRITGESYVCYSSIVEKGHSGWIQVKLSHDKNSKPSNYEVKCSYDCFDEGYVTNSCTFTCVNNPSANYDFNFRAVALTSIRLQFIIKSKPDDVSEMITITKSWYDAIQQQLMTDVELIGSDGIVTTKMELLMAMSPTFKAMFATKSTKEFETKKVEIKEYSKSVLTAFVKFLEDHKLIDGKENACDLLLLADKYHVPSLKKRAEKFLLDNVTTGNARSVHKIFTAVSPDLLEELFVRTVAIK